jgi:hypothetical protein
MTAGQAPSPIDPEWLAFPPRSRFVIEPDPAWDAADETDGGFVVEVSWCLTLWRAGVMNLSPAPRSSMR